MEFAQLETFVMVLLGLCAAIISISGASAAVVKFWRFLQKGTNKNTEDINEFKIWLSSDKRRIENLEKRQAEADRMNKLQLKALVTLLGHEIDGNHTNELKHVRDEIQGYLIEGRTVL